MDATVSFPPSCGTMRDYARAYLAAGWSLFPVEPGSKIPCTALLPQGSDGRPSWKSFQHHAPSMRDVDSWLASVPDLNLAVVTGPVSKLAVLDLDGVAGVESLRQTGLLVPRTLVQRTPRGYHALFAWGESVIRNSAGRIAAHVDVRGVGGYIVITPSRRPDGMYTWMAREPMALAPTWMADHEQCPAAPWAVAGADRWVRRALLEGAPEGQRNETACRLVGYFHAKGLAEDLIEAILQPFASHCTPPLGTHELGDVIRKVSRYPVTARTRAGATDGGVVVLS